MKNNDAIGGYFGMELMLGKEFHSDAIRLNTGRNALEYIFRAKAYKKVFIPFYTCAAILEPINKLNIAYQFYTIDENFEPDFDFDNLGEEEAFLYTNYFGLKDMYIQKISKHCKNLIIDNAQAFFSPPINGVDTFYSPRKFFGVSDGAYLYTNKKLDYEFDRDVSYKRFTHLLMRWEKGAEFGYSTFIDNEEQLENEPIKQMSFLTQKIMEAVDYGKVAEKRIRNYNKLHTQLESVNQLSFSVGQSQVPMIYPLLVNKKGLRNELIGNRIFVPLYWSNVFEWTTKKSMEYHMARNIVFLPIDQRYGKDDMDRLLNALNI